MPQKKNATLGLIAAKAGVSRAVAGRVLIGTGAGVIRVGVETADRIRRIAQALDYRPNRMAQQLAGGKSNAIGLIFAVQAPHVTIRRAASIEAVASTQGYRVLIGRFDQANPVVIRDYFADFLGRGVDGVIIIDHSLSDRDAMRAIFRQAARHRVVFQSQAALARRAYRVALDLADGSLQAVRHLHGRGHTRIGLAINGAETPARAAREEGFFAGLKACGLPARDGLVWRAAGNVVSLDREQVEDLFLRLVKEKDVTALITANDYWALQISSELARRGLRVPEDVAVVGYNNLEFTPLVHPPLTTFDENEDEVSRHLLRFLLAQIERRSLPLPERLVRVRPRLIVRQSS